MNQSSVWIASGQEERLAAVLEHARRWSPVQRARLEEAGAVPPLDRIPVMRKERLGEIQKSDPPFGGLLGVGLGDLARIFLSPGEIFDPQGPGADFWRFRTALMVAGFQPREVVINCFNYHLTPAGFMFDAAARALGCVVIPAGVGQQEMQLKVMAATGTTGYVGLPSYLLSLLERAEAAGLQLQLRRAVVTGEPLTPSLREALRSRGVSVLQAYGTADVGLIAYECPEAEGLHLDDGVVVEICDPEGRPVEMGEIGEVVVTLLEPTYPLIRFGTGDLSAMVAEPCRCGRPSLRLKGWLGRVGDVVKVRGIFVYPRQIEEALAAFGGAVGRWQARVERDEHHRDRLLLRVEAAPGEQVDPDRLVAAVRAATRLTAEVEAVPPGSIPADAPRLDDRRRWE